jgi:hypothetical protein
MYLNRTRKALTISRNCARLLVEYIGTITVVTTFVLALYELDGPERLLINNRMNCISDGVEIIYETGGPRSTPDLEKRVGGGVTENAHFCLATFYELPTQVVSDGFTDAERRGGSVAIDRCRAYYGCGS